MTTIQKTINVPANHHVRIDLDLPGDIPEGEVDVLLIIAPSPTRQQRDHLNALAGSLADSPNFSGDPVSIQRNMRDDWT